MSSLYWTSGRPEIKIFYENPVSEEDSTEALRILDEYRSHCVRLWFAFNGVINGRHLAVQQWQQRSVARHNRLFVGTQFPEQEQSVGKSTFAHITFGELFDAMADGGEFEQLNAKAYIVFIDALWEDFARKRIGDVLQVKSREVKCELLADLRRLRNVIVHQSERAKREYVEKAALLPHIWDIDPNYLIITANMLQALIEQLNAVQVHIGDVQGDLG